jgi:hypothetical protein
MRLRDFFPRWGNPREAAAQSPASESRHEMRIPLLSIPDEGIGVGDAVKRVTDVFRIKPCNGCEKRRKVLNRWVIKGARATTTGRGPDS